jgi:hypothetical protein
MKCCVAEVSEWVKQRQFNSMRFRKMFNIELKGRCNNHKATLCFEFAAEIEIGGQINEDRYRVKSPVRTHSARALCESNQNNTVHRCRNG